MGFFQKEAEALKTAKSTEDGPQFLGIGFGLGGTYLCEVVHNSEFVGVKRGFTYKTLFKILDGQDFKNDDDGNRLLVPTTAVGKEVSWLESPGDALKKAVSLAKIGDYALACLGMDRYHPDADKDKLKELVDQLPKIVTDSIEENALKGCKLWVTVERKVSQNGRPYPKFSFRPAE